MADTPVSNALRKIVFRIFADELCTFYKNELKENGLAVVLIVYCWNIKPVAIAVCQFNRFLWNSIGTVFHEVTFAAESAVVVLLPLLNDLRSTITDFPGADNPL